MLETKVGKRMYNKVHNITTGAKKLFIVMLKKCTNFKVITITEMNSSTKIHENSLKFYNILSKVFRHFKNPFCLPLIDGITTDCPPTKL